MYVINMNMIMNNQPTCIMKDFGQIIIPDESQTTKTSNYKTGIYFSNMHKDKTNQFKSDIQIWKEGEGLAPR